MVPSRLVVLALIAALCSSCGRGDEIGACRRVEGLDLPFSGALASGDDWVRIELYSLVSEPADPPTDRTVTMAVQMDGAEQDIYTYDLVAADLAAVMDEGHPATARATATARYDPYITTAFAVVDDEVTFLGDCAHRYTEVLARIAEETGRGSEELMDEFIAVGAGSDLAAALSRD